MKKILAFIIIAIGFSAGHAAFAAGTVTSTASPTATSFTVNYHYAGTPSSTAKLYSWLQAASSSSWIDQSNLLITIPASSVQVVKDFSVTYDFAALGLANGTYNYLLADGTTGSANIVYGPAQFTVGTSPAAGDNDGTCNPSYDGTVSAPLLASTPGLCSNGTMTGFLGSANGPWTWTCSPAAAGGTSDSCTATLAAGASAASTQTISGVTIAFQPGQSITDTAATIPILVSVGSTMNVDLSAYVAPVGSTLQTPQPLLSQTISATAPVNTALRFTGLTPGQAYFFSVENNATGAFSQGIQFTTTSPNAAAPASPAAPSTASTASPSGSSSVGPVDTISDKGIVPLCGRTTGTGTQMCTFKDFMQLVANVVSYGSIILFIAFTVALLYSGFMLIWLGKNGDPSSEIEKKRKQYGAVLVRMIVGLIIIALAWTAISTILIALGVQHNYILLDIFNGR